MSEIICEQMGVNRGAVTSPFLSKEYSCDIINHLNAHMGICVQDEILVYELWADDLYMLADCVINSRKQLDGLGIFLNLTKC